MTRLKTLFRKHPPELAQLIAEDVGRTARPIAYVALAVYAVFAFAHFALLEGITRNTMTLTAAISALAIGVFVGLERAGKISNQFLLMGVLSIATANSLLHMGLTEDARQSTNFLLLMMAVGFFVLEKQMMASLTIALVAAWLFVMPRDEAEFTHYAFAIALALVLAVTMGMIRRRNLHRIAKG